MGPGFKNSTAQIKCTSNSHIYFSQSQYIHIANLEFIGCGGNQVKQVEKFVVQDMNFKGQEGSRTALMKQQHRLSTALLYPIGCKSAVDNLCLYY